MIRSGEDRDGGCVPNMGSVAAMLRLHMLALMNVLVSIGVFKCGELNLDLVADLELVERHFFLFSF